ncbi:regulator of microtubule dynamics protein 2-like isoform X2 [Lethenteron reissneri]|uniref:regulator of microtubule dynamics protein 2-like isoform X2 n=1 Tax=Lethenteron reissneri TaxID=7753 RepID=UPI002AB74098|nr:regulator of microtubule dynamics protein 2-like isoform X2 [Lethenteron reissneri]
MSTVRICRLVNTVMIIGSQDVSTARQGTGVIISDQSAMRPGRLSLALSALLGASVAGLSLGLVWILYRRRRGSPGGASQDLVPSSRATVVDVAVNIATSATSKLSRGHDEMVQQLGTLADSLNEARADVRRLREGLPGIVEEAVAAGSVRRRRRGLQSSSSSSFYTASPGETSSGDSEDEFGDTVDGPGQAMILLEEEELYFDEEFEELVQRADRLHAAGPGSWNEALNALICGQNKFARRGAFWWRMARASGDMCEITEEKSERLIHALTGKESAEKGLKWRSCIRECRKWFAIICLDYLWELQTTQHQMRDSFSVKRHLEQTLATNPSDPEMLHLLGRWGFAMANLTWIERRVCNSIFKNYPTSSVNEALQYFLKAEELQPNFSKANQVFIVKCCASLGLQEELQRWTASAQKLPALTAQDRRVQQDLEHLISASSQSGGSTLLMS